MSICASISYRTGMLLVFLVGAQYSMAEGSSTESLLTPELQLIIDRENYTADEKRNIDTLLAIVARPQALEQTDDTRYFCDNYKTVGQQPFATLARISGQKMNYSTSLKDVKREVKDILAKGDRVYAEIHTTATQIGPLFGVAGTGKEIKLYERDFFKFDAEGKLCESRRMMHEADLYKQLGGTLTFPIDDK